MLKLTRTRLLPLLCVAVLAAPVIAQDDDDDFPPGLLARYKVGGKSIERVDNDIAFDWGTASPDPRLTAGKFSAEWVGKLLVKKSDKYMLHAFVDGECSIRIDGNVILEGKTKSANWISSKPVELRFGERPLVVTYQKTGDSAGLKLFWQAERFPLEPIPAHLLFLDKPQPKLKRLANGRTLFDAHRCNRCHQRANDPPSDPGPDLTHVITNLSETDLTAKILNPTHDAPQSKMPTFGFDKDEAAAIAAFLRSVSKTVKLPPLPKPPRAKKGAKPVSEVRAGEILFRSVGCLACHAHSQSGTNSAHGGGDLTNISKKHSAEWIAHWLLDPKKLNADHRMPVFKLTNTERRQLALFLASARNGKSNQASGGHQPADSFNRGNVGRDRDDHGADTPRSPAAIARGRKLVEQSRCAACHTIPGVKFTSATLTDLSRPPINHKNTCLQTTTDPKTRRPAFPQLGVEPVTAVASFLESRPAKLSPHSEYEHGRLVMARRNCLGCHERGLTRGIVETAGLMSKRDNALRGQSEAMIPPSLNAVGDKLLDDYLKTAVAGEQKTVRMPWLRVRMPRFVHTKTESDAVVSYLKSHDRIPDGSPLSAKPQAKVPPESQVLVAGQTLLGVRGFSCIACHTVGDYEPRNVALGTRGSDLMHMAGRMRKPFFDRWTRAPIRIVPGMEMPSYHSKPVPGVLGNDVDLQLAVLWHALNDKRFKPPTNPSVVEQFITVNPGEPARIIRDVFTVPKENGGGYVARSLAIGLNNGHNLLFDLDTYSLRGWYFGDFARQRTQGKSWYWDMAGVPVMTGLTRGPDIILVKKDKTTGKETVYLPQRVNGITGQLFGFDTDVNRVRFATQVKFDIDGHSQFFTIYNEISTAVNKTTGALGWKWDADMTPIVQDKNGKTQIGLVVVEGADLKCLIARPIDTKSIGQPNVEVVRQRGRKEFEWRRFREFPHQEFYDCGYGGAKRVFLTNLKQTTSTITPKAMPQAIQRESITTVPGFSGERLPVSRSIMPTAIAWNRRGHPVFTSLKGEVYRLHDSDGDGLEDIMTEIMGGLAAPYGIVRGNHGLVVSHKPEVIGLRSGETDFPSCSRKVLATGWGYTDNYHDWTCGIVRDKAGNLYVGLGSDYAQPKRPKEHALWRGKVLRISPDGKITPVGHAFRYPTGLAMNHAGDIFVSDNQGVQNTFNEINHLKEGRHYGVPSRFEENPKAPTTPPAIQIPHPWTRSVNGIFFLPRRAGGVSPSVSSTKQNAGNARSGGLTPPARQSYEAFAGHGIGCEYDNRFLIRFSLQKVDGEYQGACYAFSKPGSGVGGKNFTGPLCGGVAPDGAIYIGSIYDSGWLGGRNTGDIVRLVPNGNLPNGIRELRVTKNGFEIEFIKPVDKTAALKPASYTISGYMRVWKGSYATPDSGRHTLMPSAVAITPDHKTVRLTVPGRRAGQYVYDISVGDIGTKDQPALWPATGYYTLHRIPR